MIRRLSLPLCLLVLVLSGCVGPAEVSPALGALEAEPSGTLLVGRGGDLWIVEGGTLRQFTSGGTWRQPSWSPDGSRFAYVFRAENFSEIFVMNRDGSDPKRLTSSQSTILQDSDWAFSPTWSPDGARIAYTSDASSYNPMLWVMAADGSGKRQVIPNGAGLDAIESPRWSPDGGTIALTGFKTTTSQIYRFQLSTAELSAVTATSGGAFDPAWSPNGQYIAYVAREDDQTSIHVIRADGSNDAKVADAGEVRVPTWSPDGSQLAFLSASSGHFELYLVNVETSSAPPRGSDERQVTTDLNADATSGIAWTR